MARSSGAASKPGHECEQTIEIRLRAYGTKLVRRNLRTYRYIL